MDYRREIDGLRAVAVLPAILFHAGLPGFEGGFVGVDVFLVISGYLIATLILEDVARGRFSLAHFYERRARRILPPLFVVVAVCIPFAWLWMLPWQLRDFAESVAGTALFVSNVTFWRDSGYFAAPAETMPLLHTWSLAIEEQFYLVFPLVVLAAFRFGRRALLAMLLVGALASLALAEWGWRNAPTAAFYLTPTRAWELLTGALVALALFGRGPRGNEALAALGLAAIVAAVVLFDAATPFPSLYALVPVGGAALIVAFATSATWTGRLLGTRALVGIGLISYGAYLWHQPLFAFARLRSPFGVADWVLLVLAVAALGLGYLSWRFVERPFRRREAPLFPQRRRLLGAAGAGMAVLALVGTVGIVSDGGARTWAARVGPEAAQTYALMEAVRRVPDPPRTAEHDGRCVFEARRWSADLERRLLECHVRHGPGVAVLGDSHAVDQFGVLTRGPQARRFLIGLGQPFCDPARPRPGCVFADMAAFVERYPEVFRAVVYVQAGFYLLRDAHGRTAQQRLWRIPPDRPMPALDIQHEEIADTADYLERLDAHVPAVWLGPRIEPHLPQAYVVRHSCDRPFALRPGQEAAYAALDAAIAARLEGTGVRHLSHTEVYAVAFPRDFMDCRGVLWQGLHHLSAVGEARLAARRDLLEVVDGPD